MNVVRNVRYLADLAFSGTYTCRTALVLPGGASCTV